MRIFLYELITGGGYLGQATPPLPSLLAEGRAMIEAVAADFALVAGVEVNVLRDARLPTYFVPGVQVREVHTAAEEADAFHELASTADWTLLIAPETEGLLEQRARTVLACGGRLLGPPPEVIALCADKQRTAEHLAAAGIVVPYGIRIATGEDLPEDFPYPAVVKPIDGCGSQEIYRVDSFAQRPPVANYARRLEQAFLPNPDIVRLSLSVSVLACAGRAIALPTCGQDLSQDGRFIYEGGHVLPMQYHDGIPQVLALRAIESLPDALGYFGVDIVFGGMPLVAVVIEINPRLTTSYIGLRRAVDVNLAGLMLDFALGKTVKSPQAQRAFRFSVDGKIVPFPSSP